MNKLPVSGTDSEFVHVPDLLALTVSLVHEQTYCQCLERMFSETNWILKPAVRTPHLYCDILNMKAHL